MNITLAFPYSERIATRLTPDKAEEGFKHLRYGMVVKFRDYMHDLIFNIEFLFAFQIQTESIWEADLYSTWK